MLNHQHISSDSFNEKTLDPQAAAALHADVLVSQKKLVEIGSSAVLDQSKANQASPEASNATLPQDGTSAVLKASSRNLADINTQPVTGTLNQGDTKKATDSPSPKSPAKIHHHSTARMQNVIEEQEKRLIEQEKEAKAAAKA